MKTRIVALLVAAVMLFGMCNIALAEDYTVDYLSCWSGASAGFPEDISGNICAQLIAEKFGISESKVKITLMRTRKKLKAYLVKEGWL